MKLKKNERRQAIQQAIENNPFITDNELCEMFQVSIQTIRLDRTHLNIPELRKRVKLVAEHNYDQIKSIEVNEIIGDLVQLKPNDTATSMIEITSDSVFSKSQIARGHVLFAQANSLCVALIHNPTVLTQESDVKFLDKVKLNDTVKAVANVINQTNKHYLIEVNSYVKDKLVLLVNLKCSI